MTFNELVLKSFEIGKLLDYMINKSEIFMLQK